MNLFHSTRPLFAALVSFAAAVLLSVMHAVAQPCTGNFLFHQWPAEPADQVRPGINVFNNRTPDCVIGWDPDGAGPLQEWTIVGGDIAQAGNTAVANIAAYDGTTWRALGAGFNERVSHLAVLNGELYAAGGFTASGATPINYVARWNGTAWQPLAGGPGGTVNSMHVWNNQIVVGNPLQFGQGRARAWNGSTWASVGTDGVRINAFATYSGQLVAARGASSADRVTMWNGSAWVDLGTAFTGSISSLAVLGSELIAGGGFSTAGGVPASNIARWNGTAWSALGSGTSSSVNALAVLGSELFACGGFSTAGGVTVNNVARWDGTAWNAMRSGLVNTGAPVDMAVVRGRINVVGAFTHAALSEVPMPGIATWNAAEQIWEAVSSSFDAQINCFLEFQGKLYAGGRFTRAGGNDARGLAAWDGLTWQPVGSMPLRTVNALAEYNGQLIAAGSVLNPDLSSSNRVIRFDGTDWLSLTDAASSNFDSSISSMIVYNGDLYVAGRFSTAGGVAANRIARWNGTTWSPLQQGLTGTFGSQSSPFASTLAVYNNELYVGGAFVNAGSVTNVNHVARWNGTTWNRAGTLNGWSTFAFVASMAVFQGQLYATGNALFTPGQEIGRWNGTTWTGLPNALSGSDNFGSVGGRSMCVHNGNLYVGGVFSSAGGITSYKIVRYTGTTWQSVGTAGLGSTASNRDIILALSSYKSDLMIGGRFTAAGTAGSGNFLRFTETNIPWIARQPQDATVCAGATAAFSAAAATGYLNLTYRWQIETGPDTFADITSNMFPGISAVSGQNTPALAISTLPSNSGFRFFSLRCVISNTCGEAISNRVSLFIEDAPFVSGEPAGISVCSASIDESDPISVVVGPPVTSFNLIWQIEDANSPNGWRTLEDGLGEEPLILPTGETCGFYRYSPLGLVFRDLCAAADGNRFGALVNNGCGSDTSAPATLSIRVCPCSPSDVAGAGQNIGGDGQLTADDIIVFIGWFFAPDARADVAGSGQVPTPDGQFTADDIIVFINRFFAGCP
jgi:hypothetical protein